MTTQRKKPSPLFPNMPVDQKVVDSNGNLTATWGQSLNDVYQGLQTNYSNEGILFPPLSSSDMSTIQAKYTALINNPLPQGTQDISGKTIFNSTDRSPYQFIITYDASNPPKVSTAQWVQFSMLLTFGGDPNGNVGGALNWICYNTVDSILYICTTAGSANGTPSPQAVWTGINGASNMFLLL